MLDEDYSSPDEEEAEFARGDTDSDNDGDDLSPAGPHPGASSEQADLGDGMLLRDLPKRSTFYDPVAEREMSQTDAKLFYQMSQLEKSGRDPQNALGPDDSADLSSSLELPQPGIPMANHAKPEHAFATQNQPLSSPSTHQHAGLQQPQGHVEQAGLTNDQPSSVKNQEHIQGPHAPGIAHGQPWSSPRPQVES